MMDLCKVSDQSPSSFCTRARLTFAAAYRIACVVVVVALCAISLTPANATPDRSASIDDVPIGHTDDHLFLLRTVGDNMGSYYSAIEYVFLVKQHMMSGRVDDQWLVRMLRFDQRFEWPKGEPTPPSRIVTEPDNYHDGESPLVDKSLPLKGVNPFEILRREGAVSLSALSQEVADAGNVTWKVSSAGGLTKIKKADGSGSDTVIKIYTTAELKRRVATALHPTIAKLNKVRSVSDPVGGPYEAVAISPTFEYCQVTSRLSINLEIRETYQQRNFAAIICEDDHEVGRWLTWIYVGGKD